MKYVWNRKKIEYEVNDNGCHKRGRPYSGEKHFNSKLTEDQIKEIKVSEKTIRKLAKIYKVGKTTIGSIRIGKTWRHVNVEKEKEGNYI